MPDDDGGAIKYAQPNLEPDDWAVSPVFVPTDVPPSIVAESGYAFDRYVMRGLFTWGRIMAMRRILGTQPDGTIAVDRKLPSQLAWPAALALAVGTYAQQDQDDATLKSWSTAYTLPECADFRSKRLTDGKARITNLVADCAPPTDTGPSTPRYFTCPANAQEPSQ